MTREERRPCCRKIATKGPDVLPGDNRSLKEAQLSRRDNVELPRMLQFEWQERNEKDEITDKHMRLL